MEQQISGIDKRKESLKNKKSVHQIREEKTMKFIEWLTIFHHSTLDITLDSLGLQKKGQRSFIKSLEEKGLIQYLNLKVTRQKIVMLSPEGKLFASSFNEDAVSYLTEPSRISYNQLYHHLSLQKVVVGCMKNEDVQSYYSTRTLDYSIKNGKKVDALLVMNDGKKVGIEFERSYKEPRRIIRGFLDHILDMRDKNYHEVRYYFLSGTMKNRYEELFNQTEWEVHKKNSYGKLSKTKDIFRPDEYEGLRASFRFIYDEKYVF